MLSLEELSLEELSLEELSLEELSLEELSEVVLSLSSESSSLEHEIVVILKITIIIMLNKYFMLLTPK
ncbi:MAG: hypothetical protein ACJ0DG_07820 [bacterium]